MSSIADIVTAAEVAEQHRLEERCAAARRLLKRREKARDEHRAKLRERVALNDAKDSGDVHELHGFTLRRVRKSSGKRFDLTAYLDARKGRMPAALRPFVKTSEYEMWEVARAD